MTVRQKIKNLVIGIGLVLLGALMLLWPEYGCIFMLWVLAVCLVIGGIRDLVFYFCMARFMVGGGRILWQGILCVVLGLVAGTATQVSKIILLVILMAGLVTMGAISFLRAMKFKAIHGKWKGKVIKGALYILVPVCGCIFAGVSKTTDFLAYLYIIGIVYEGAVRIISVFKKTALIYIQ